MADIINTLRGPKLFAQGTVRGRYYIIPVMADLVAPISFGAVPTGRMTHDREYYQLKSDGEWHWSHTEEGHFQKYPCYEPAPEWELPEGV